MPRPRSQGEESKRSILSQKIIPLPELDTILVVWVRDQSGKVRTIPPIHIHKGDTPRPTTWAGWFLGPVIELTGPEKDWVGMIKEVYYQPRHYQRIQDTLRTGGYKDETNDE